MDQDAVIESIDAKSIYEVPVLMKEEKLDEVVLRKLSMPSTVEPDLSNWSLFLEKWSNPNKTVRIGLVGKYVELKDSYKSIAESFIHAGAANQVKVELRWIHSEKLNEENVGVMLDGLSGLLVAPGFGSRGIEGKICAIKHAREYRIPFLGICLGMQCAVIEFARNVLNLKGAHTTEIDPDSPNPVIDLMDDQKSITDKGGTMRLGAYPCELNKDSVAYHAYGRSEISERHRHRYEFNNDYLSAFEEAGMSAAGINPLSGLVEIIEIKDHPWFVGVQFHPEYKSTVAMPHPIFNSFVKAVVNEEHLVKA